MTIKLGVVMDPIEHSNYEKDSTLAMLWEAKARGWEIYYFQHRDLFLRDSVAYGCARIIDVFEDKNNWYSFKDEKTIPLSDLDVLLMRKDPPFNTEYLYSTYILEVAAHSGVLVVNNPRSLRDCNEKFFATAFPDCVPPHVVTQSEAVIKDFWREHKDIVVKPLDAMGGSNIFRLQENESQASAIIDKLTNGHTIQIMAQKYLPAITEGDKRILMINGKPVPYVLARVPKEGDWRGNLALGATGVVKALTERDRFIAEAVGPALVEKGLLFVGLDVIGDYLTEINVTSPTCIREIERGSDANIRKQLMDAIEAALPS